MSIWHGYCKRNMRTGIWQGDLQENVHFEDLDADVRITLKSVFKKYDENVCTGFIWLKKGMSGTFP
jgi:hypothetical protein